MMGAYFMVAPSTNGAARINSFALVAYIPPPMGDFLDGLRRELERDAPLSRSHVTVLPPRPVSDLASARDRLAQAVAAIPAFEIEAGEVTLFETTSVVYLAVLAGRDQLIRAHALLNTGALGQVEAFDYCPHITVAQNLPPERVRPAIEHARRRWAAYPGPRRFPLESLTFVQNTEANCWLDVTAWPVAMA
jgi:2'-5' RNA ligase